jgi:hypothetical protein
VIIPGGAEDFDVESQEFGWDHFTAGSKRAKLHWLGHAVSHVLPLNDEIRRMAINGIMGIDDFSTDGYIDHQSVIDLPMSFDGKGPHPEYLKEVVEFLSRDDVVILGGSDQDDEVHPLRGKATKDVDLTPYTDRSSSPERVARKEDGYWVIFDREGGTKVRFAIGEGAVRGEKKEGQPIARCSRTPELVDVKITDYCDGKCGYCYQGSSKYGTHASLGDIQNLVYSLKYLEVFEVAIGGGEPTLHPDFAEILSIFRSHYIVPNFTTKRKEWLFDDGARKILDLCGSFALSVTNEGEVDRLICARDYIYSRGSFPDGKFCINVVMGTVSMEALRNIAKKCRDHGVDVTLLGFKKPKRTPEEMRWFQKQPYDGWLDAVKGNYGYTRVGIDTALAKEFQVQLDQTGVPKTLYTTEEGVFSMYIDLVDGKMGPSSYCSKKDFIDIKPSTYNRDEQKYLIGTQQIQEAFDTFKAKALKVESR